MTRLRFDSKWWLLTGIVVCLAAMPGTVAGVDVPPVTPVVWVGSGYGTYTIDELQTIPYIQSNGRVVLFAWIDGPGVDASNDVLVLDWVQGALGTVCREGDPLPAAGAGVTHSCSRGGVATPDSTFSTEALDGAGVTSANDTVRILYNGSVGQIVVREGDPAPGADGSFTQVGLGSHPRVNGQGSVVFKDTLTGGSDVWAYFSGGSSVSAFVRSTDPVPGLPGTWGYTSDPFLSPSGHIAFDGHTVDGSNYPNGVWWGTAGGAGPLFVAGTGTNDPGGGGLINTLIATSISRTGEVAIAGELASGLRAIWVGDPSSLRRVAIEGGPAPGGGTFSDLESAMLNGLGEPAILGRVSGDRVIVIESDRALEHVVGEGDPAPGLTDNEVFDELWTGPIPNSAGQVAFSADLDGPNVVQNVNSYTIWMRDTSGSLIMIARAQETLEVAPGEFKTVLDLMFGYNRKPFGIENGGGSLFNDLGQLVFWAEFTDGTAGVFMSQPEPVLPLTIFADGFESGDTSAWSQKAPE